MLRALAKEIAPPALIELYRRIRYGVILPANAVVGDFPTWSDIAALTGPYETNLELVGGMARSYRAEPPPLNAWPVAINILRAAVEFGRSVHVGDFGGSLALQYFALRGTLGNALATWTVSDLAAVVAYGTREFTEPGLTFTTEMPAVTCDVVVAGCVLCYFEDPYTMLERLIVKRPSYVILDRTPVLPTSRRFMVQSVPVHLGGGLRCWQVLDERRVAQVMKDYAVVLSHSYIHPPPHFYIPYLARVYRRRE